MLEGAQAKAEELGLTGVILAPRAWKRIRKQPRAFSRISPMSAKSYNRPFAPPVALITGGHLDVPVGEFDRHRRA